MKRLGPNVFVLNALQQTKTVQWLLEGKTRDSGFGERELEYQKK